jgi:hypothetical protein
MTTKKTNREIDAKTIELALKWANDEVSLADVARKLGTVNMTHSYTTLARALKQAIKKDS